MQVKLIAAQMDAYRRHLSTPAASAHIHWWESQRVFQEQWAPGAEDFAAMYDRSLQNSHTRRLWKREGYEPKRVMLLLCQVHEDFARQTFRDLFNENSDIVGRVDRFVFHCDELLATYRQAHPLKTESRHYHDDDHGMVSMYLAFRYPAQYAPYDHRAFVTLLQRLGARELPAANDFGRHCKVMRTLHTLLAKDEALLAAHRRRLLPGLHYEGESLLLAYDFVQFVAS